MRSLVMRWLVMRSLVMRSLAVPAVAVALAVPSGAMAQATQPRPETPREAPAVPRALWATLSAGRGDLQINCAICRRTDQSSWTADVAVGGWIARRATFGGELGAWRIGGDEATQRVMLLGVASQLYPLQEASAFVKLGVGVMAYRASDGEQSLGAR